MDKKGIKGSFVSFLTFLSAKRIADKIAAMVRETKRDIRTVSLPVTAPININDSASPFPILSFEKTKTEPVQSYYKD